MGNYFRAGQGKTVGDQRVYRRKNVQPFIGKYQALSIPVWEIERLTKRVKEVMIFDEFSKMRYVTNAENFRKGEVTETHFGEQVFVGIENFEMKIGRS